MKFRICKSLILFGLSLFILIGCNNYGNRPISSINIKTVDYSEILDLMLNWSNRKFELYNYDSNKTRLKKQKIKKKIKISSKSSCNNDFRDVNFHLIGENDSYLIYSSRSCHLFYPKFINYPMFMIGLKWTEPYDFKSILVLNKQFELYKKIIFNEAKVLIECLNKELSNSDVLIANTFLITKKLSPSILKSILNFNYSSFINNGKSQFTHSGYFDCKYLWGDIAGHIPWKDLSAFNIEPLQLN